MVKNVFLHFLRIIFVRCVDFTVGRFTIVAEVFVVMPGDSSWQCFCLPWELWQISSFHYYIFKLQGPLEMSSWRARLISQLSSFQILHMLNDTTMYWKHIKPVCTVRVLERLSRRSGDAHTTRGYRTETWPGQPQIKMSPGVTYRNLDSEWELRRTATSLSASVEIPPKGELAESPSEDFHASDHRVLHVLVSCKSFVVISSRGVDGHIQEQ